MKGLKGKIRKHVSHHCEQFSKLACWLAWGVPIWHCWRTGFNLESCFLPYLFRETDQQPGQKSIWAKSHLIKWCSQWLRKPFHFKALLNEGLSRQKWLQKSGWLTKRKLFKNYKTEKMSFRLRKFEDPGYVGCVVATNYKSARNRPTNIMEPGNIPTTLDFASYIRHLRLGHLPAPIKDLQDARWTRTHTKMTSTNSKRFHSSHLSTNPQDLFGKNWAHQGFTNKSWFFYGDLGKKWWKWSNSPYEQYHSHGYLKYAPSAISLQSCNSTAEGAGGKHAICVIPIRFTLQQWCAVSSHRKGWMWWMRWKGFSDERLWLDGWDGCNLCDLCCDELVISVVSLGTGSSSIVGQKAPTQPAASSGWDAEAALGLPRNRVWTDGSRPNLCDRQSLGMSSQERRYQGRPYSTSSMRWTFEKYRWSRWRWEHKPVLQDTSLHGPLQTLNSKRKIHPRIPQWMFMFESSLCFLNPFVSFLNLFHL